MVKLSEGFECRVFAEHVPLEEILVRTEDAAHAINLDTLPATSDQIVCPELVFNENCNLRMCQA